MQRNELGRTCSARSTRSWLRRMRPFKGPLPQALYKALLSLVGILWTPLIGDHADTAQRRGFVPHQALTPGPSGWKVVSVEHTHEIFTCIPKRKDPTPPLLHRIFLATHQSEISGCKAYLFRQEHQQLAAQDEAFQGPPARAPLVQAPQPQLQACRVA